MFKDYDSKIRKILAEKQDDLNWKEILDNHSLMISRIQHERLIHLLVTIFVGVVMTLSFLFTIALQNLSLAVLDIPLIFLFVGYLFHYRFLENTTQRWYILEDKLKLNAKK